MPAATTPSDTGAVPTRVTSSRFIGRTRELAELEAAIRDASDGRPSLAFIAGESGVGKTRLLNELERRALDADVRVLTGDCVALGEDELPYAPILGAEPEAALVDRLHRRSEGNPLFTEELLAAGLDGRGELPPTLRDALMVRIEALSQPAQEILRLLAPGRRLDHATLADASGLNPGVLREALREAVAGHIVVVVDDDQYAFRHALLREVVHDDLLPGEAAELHLALARALDRRVQNGGSNYAPPAHTTSTATRSGRRRSSSARSTRSMSRPIRCAPRRSSSSSRGSAGPWA